jgi:hypothetical protein
MILQVSVFDLLQVAQILAFYGMESIYMLLLAKSELGLGQGVILVSLYGANILVDFFGG